MPGIVLNTRELFTLEQYGVTREAMQGALITISVFLNIPVLRAATAAEVVKLVQYTVGQDGKFNAQVAQRHGYRPKRRRNRQLYLLQGLPGIGSRKAENLLAHFGSIRDIVNADEAELALVEGIGKKLAQRIRELLD